MKIFNIIYTIVTSFLVLSYACGTETWDLDWSNPTSEPPNPPFATVAGGGESVASSLFTINGSFNAYNRDTAGNIIPLTTLSGGTIQDATGITIEVTMKVLTTQSTDRAFGIDWIDGSGGCGAWWSQSKIELGPAIDMDTNKLQAFPMDNTNDFHIYRLTQDANSNTFTLYVDNSSTASLTNIPGDTIATFDTGRLHFGRIGTYTLSNCNVQISDLRYHAGATPPPSVSGSTTETWTVVYPADDYPASSNPKWPAGCPAGNQQQFINDPSPGYLTISTWIDPSEYDANRDTAVSYLTGITIECRALVYSSCSSRGFQVQWLDAGGNIGMYLSPNKVEAGDGLYSSIPASTTFNTTTAYHIYRITRSPSTNNVQVYIDNQTTSPFTGSATHTLGGGPVSRPSIPVYSSDILTNRILFGDNGVANCNIVIDYVRYHPGAQAPGGVNNLGVDTTPPPTPNQWANLTTDIWDGQYDGTGSPTSQGWIEAGGGQEYNSYFGISSTGFFTMDGDCNAYRSITTATLQQDTTGITIEMRLQVAPDSPDRAFNLLYDTYQGSIGLYISPSKIEIGDGSDPCGIANLPPYYFNTTTGFHIYRLTMPPHYSVNDNVFANLYIDNNPTPVFSNAEGDFEEIPPRIMFGNWAIFPLVSPYLDVCVDYIRWHRGVTPPQSQVFVKSWEFYK